MSKLQISGTDITSSADDLNILDGVTATTVEINYIDGVTSNIQTQLDDRYTETEADAKFALKTEVAAGGNFTSGSIGGSFGSITTTSAITGGSLVTGDITIGASKIGHSTNDDLIAMSASTVVVDGTLEATTLKIGATNVATELSNRYTKTEADAAFGATTGTSNIVTVGALDSGSISDGFGDIDIGTSSIAAGSLSIGSVVTTGATIGHKDDLDLLSLASGKLTVAGTMQATTININGTDVTSSASQLNILDGVTVVKDNINHLSNLDTNVKVALTDRYTKAEADSIFGSTSGNSNIVTVGPLSSGSITANFGDINNGSNSITTSGKMTAGELEVDDLTFNNSSISHSAGANLIFSSGKATVGGKIDSQGLMVNGALVTSSVTDLNILDGVTASTSDINILDGLTASQIELNHVKGVTSAIQTQLDTKLATATADASYAPIDGASSIVTVGAIDSGSITSNFGSINTGASSITTSGTMQAGALEVDNIVINSSTIGHASNPGLLSLAVDSLAIGNNTNVNGVMSANSIKLNNVAVTSSAAEINKLEGIDTTSAELDHVHGVTGAIQTQLNDRYTKSEADAAFITSSGSSNTVTVGALNSGSITTNFGQIYPGSSTIKTDGNMVAGNLEVDNVVINNSTIGHVNNTSLLLLGSNSLTINSDTTVSGKVTATNLKLGAIDVTSTGAELNKLAGIDTTSNELDYVHGVTSSIQPQINAKLDTATANASYAPINGGATIVTTGALDSGSITSNFGSINVGSSPITTSGDMQSGKITVDSIVIDSSTIGHTSNANLLLLEATKLTVNKDTEIQGKMSATTISLGGTDVTATAAHLNTLDGITSTTDELNRLYGFTGTAAKLNFTNNVTSDIQAQFNNRYTKSEADATFGTLSSVGDLDGGSITSGFGNIDVGSSSITSGGLLSVDTDADQNDATADSASGRLTLGAGQDLNLYHGGSSSYIVNKTGDLIMQTTGGSGGVIIDSKDSTVEIKGDGSLMTTIDSSGINVASGDQYKINGTSVLTNNTLGSGVTNSSLTSVGILNSGSISSGFGNINTGPNTIQTTGTISGGTLSDGTASLSSGSLTGLTGVTVQSSTPNVIIKSTDSGDGPAKLTMIGDNAGDAGDGYQFVSQYGSFKLVSDHTSQGTFSDTILQITGSNTASNRQVNVTGKLSASEINLSDNNSIKIGSSGDLDISHNGTDSFISTSTGTLNISTTNSGRPVNIGHSTSEVTIGDNLNVNGDTTIQGNLNVIGEFTQTNTTTHVVQDRLIKIGDGNTGTATDLGIVFTRGNGSATNKANTSLLYHESGNTFAFANTNEEDGTTSGNVSINDYANLRVGGLTADDQSIFTQGLSSAGDITLSANTSSITHTGSNKLMIHSSTGTVEVGGVEINGQAVSGITSLTATTLVGGLTTANQPGITSLGNLDTVGATDGTLAVRGNLNVGTSGQGKTVRFYSKNSNSVGMVWDASSGTSDQHGSLTLGADDNGVDFTAFGDSSGKYVKWDSSANSLSTTGNLIVSGGGVIQGTISTSTQNSITTASGLTTVGTLNSGAISSGFGNIDVGPSQIATSGLLRVLVDADSDNASGSSNGGRLTLGTGQDLNLYHGGSNSYIVNKTGDLVVTTGTTGNSIILDAANDTIEMKGSGIVQATVNGTGLDLASGNVFKINGDNILSSTTLGTNVVTSSLTTVGALDSGSITGNFGNIDVGSNQVSTSGLLKVAGNADADDKTADSNTGRLAIGAADNLNMYHGGVNSYIVNNTGNLVIATEDSGLGITLDSKNNTTTVKGGGNTIATFTSNGIELEAGKDILFDGTSLFSTTELGSTIVSSSLTSVGDLNSGSITSGFGSINTGSSNITTTGTTSTGDLTITGTTESTDTSTGSLIVGGGAGITGDTNIGGKLTVTGESVLAGGVSFQDTELVLTTNSFDADSKGLVFKKSRNPTDGDHAVVREDDIAGSLLFMGSDGNSFEKAADIRGVIDGTPGETVMPGRLEFLTTNDGSFIPTEKMRIAQDGQISMYNNLSVGGTTELVGATIMNDTLSVGGGSTLEGGVNVIGASTISGGMAIEGSTTINGTLSVGQIFGSQAIQQVVQHVEHAGLLVVDGNGVEGPGDLSVSNTTTLTGATTIGSTLSVANNVYLNGELSAGTTCINGTLSVGGQITYNGLLNPNQLILDDFIIGKTTLLISGASTLHDTLSVGGSLTASGATKLKDTLSVTGATNMEDTLSLASSLDVVGATVMNDTLSVGGGVTITTSILPSSNEEADIGAPGKRFRDLFIAENSIYMGDQSRLTADNGKFRVVNRVLTKIPPQIRLVYPTFATAQAFALNTVSKANLADLTTDDWLTIAIAKLDEAPQNRINGKTKDVLTIGDVFADVTVQQLTNSTSYNTLTAVEKLAKMNEFNSEFSEISADAWNSTVNQVIGGANVLAVTDSS